MAETYGRIDVHSHLLPGIDDGCGTLEESLECARRLVDAGYTHSFCTPHIWPNLPNNTVRNIAERVDRLQEALDEANIPLRLWPGGELNLSADLPRRAPEEIVTYGMRRRYCLFDLWAERLPPFFEPGVRWLQSLGLTVILAHPERMRAVQDDPHLVDRLTEMGLLLQGNLQCFADPIGSHTRRVAERFLSEGRYFMLGTDLHGTKSLPIRLKGLENVIERVGEEQATILTRANPLKLLG